MIQNQKIKIIFKNNNHKKKILKSKLKNKSKIKK